MLWWTECHDPVVGPNVIGETFVNFKADVSFSGGNGYGNVAATDSTGNSCPVTPPPPGEFSAGPVYFECNGSQAGIRIMGGSSSGATGYKIYWRGTNNSGDSPRSSSYYQDLTGSLPYTNYSFTPGYSYTVDVAATNSGGDTWATGGWWWNTIPSGCGDVTPITVKLYASSNNPSVVAESDTSITVASGSTVTLRWTTSGTPDSCSIDNGIGGITTTSSQTADYNVTTSRTYTATCIKAGTSNATDPVTVNVGGGGSAPTVSLSANPTSVSSGGASTLTWTTGNSPTSCTASGGWSGSKATGGGSQSTGALSTTTTFYIYCSNVYGNSPTASATVTVGGGGSAPTVNLSASPTSVTSGGASTLTWTTGNSPTSCTASGGWSGSKATGGGSQSTGALSTTTTFYIYCSNVYGNSPTASATVTVSGGSGTFSVSQGCSGTNHVVTATVSSNPGAGYLLPDLINNVGTLFSKTGGGWGDPYPINFTFTNVATPAGNNWTVRFTNTNSALTWTSAPFAVVDCAPPTRPSNLSVSTTCPGGVLTVNFGWTDNATTESGYYVDVTTTAAGWGSWSYRSLSANSASTTWSASSPLTQNGSLFTTPSASTAYYFRVNAWNANGDSYTYYGGGAVQPGSSFSTGSPCIPAAPTNLSVSTACPSGVLTVTFGWTDNASNETNYYVDVTTTAAGWGGWSYKNLAANSTSFAWSSSNQLTPNGGANITSPAVSTSYYWRVNAYNGNDSRTYYGGGAVQPGSSFSTGSPCIPAAPTNLSVSTACPSGVLTVTFGWTDNASNETNYYVDVTTTAAGWGGWSYKNLAANSTSFAWSSSNQLTPNGGANITSPAVSTSYYWRVNAYNGNDSRTYYGGGAVQPGSSFSTGSPCGQQPPTNLAVSSSCLSGILTVNFSWTDNAASEAWYYIDVTTTSFGWGGWSYRSVAANSTSFAWSSNAQIYNNGGDTIPSPAPDSSYYWRVNAFDGNDSRTYYGGSGSPPGNSFTTIGVCVQPPATNLNVSTTCPSGVLTVSFSWTDNAPAESVYYIDVTTTAAGWSSWSYRNLTANTTSYAWSASNALIPGGSAFTVPAANTGYYWRVNAYNPPVTSYTYYGGGAVQPGNSFNTGSPCAPAAPTNLNVSTACPSGVLTVSFSWTDNASDEDNYFVDVSTDNFATWTHTTAAQTPAIAGTGTAGSFVWSTNNQLTNTGATGGTAFAPALSTTYAWRANAFKNPNINSVTVGTNIPTGNPCAPTGLANTIPTCAVPSVTFSWTGAATSGWAIDLRTDNTGWASGGIAYKPVSSGINTNSSGFLTNPGSNPYTFVPGQIYYWRMYYAVPGSWVYPPSSSTPTGASFTWPSCPPTSLSYNPLPACSAASYPITFNWTGTGTPWTMQISNNGFASVLTSKNISNTAGPLTTSGSDFAPGITFNANTTYSWRVQYQTTPALYAVPGAPYTTFSVPGCLDLKARFVKPFAQTIFNPGEQATVKVRVFNVGNFNYGGGSGALGFWPTATGTPSVPVGAASCTPATPASGVIFSTGNTGSAGNLPAIAIGGSTDVDATFTVGNTPGSSTATSFVFPGCSPTDVYWPNNHTSGAAKPENPTDVSTDNYPTTPGGFTYTINIDGWFQTQGGDVGAAAGNVTMKKVPPSGTSVVSAGASNKPFLISSAIPTAGSSGTSQPLSSYVDGVTFKSYNKSLMPASPYTYLAERFLNKATDRGNCASIQVGLNKCTPSGGTWNLGASTAPAGNSVIIVQGNLHISGNIMAAGNNTVTFIVRDDLSVDTSVSQLDGLYVAGGKFEDTDASGTSGPQLLVNGAVYAGQVVLARVLGGACIVNCNNALFPAESFVFAAKYVLSLANLLGTPAVTWQEVAP